MYRVEGRGQRACTDNRKCTYAVNIAAVIINLDVTDNLFTCQMG